MGFRETTSFATAPPSPTSEQGEQREAYVPPRIERLGTLAELTLGGSGDPDDGHGGAGDEGSV